MLQDDSVHARDAVNKQNVMHANRTRIICVTATTTTLSVDTHFVANDPKLNICAQGFSAKQVLVDSGAFQSNCVNSVEWKSYFVLPMLLTILYLLQHGWRTNLAYKVVKRRKRDQFDDTHYNHLNDSTHTNKRLTMRMSVVRHRSVCMCLYIITNWVGTDNVYIEISNQLVCVCFVVCVVWWLFPYSISFIVSYGSRNIRAQENSNKRWRERMVVWVLGIPSYVYTNVME